MHVGNWFLGDNLLQKLREMSGVVEREPVRTHDKLGLVAQLV